MADFRKLGKGVAGALTRAKEIAAAEREANLQKFLEPSKVPQRLYHGTTATEGGKGQEAIRRIKPSKEGALGSGVYMTPNTAHASSYTGIPNDDALALMGQGNDYTKKMADQFLADRAAGTLREGQAGGNMLPVYAQIKNPLIIGKSGRQIDPAAEALINLGMDEESAIKLVEKAFEEKGNIGKQIQSRAQAQGYDGIMQYRGDDLSEVVSYNPNAVKSAIGNQGTYDIYSPDLSKAQGGGVHMVDGGKLTKGIVGALTKAKEIAQTKKADIPAMGINVRTDTKLNLPYADLIVDGEKVYESRKTDSLRPYVNKSMSIVRTGKSPAKAIGAVDIGEPLIVDAKTFRELQDKHLVPEGSMFDIEAEGQKYLYPLSNARRFDEELDVGHGIKARKVILPEDLATGGGVHMVDGGKMAKGVAGALTKAKYLASEAKRLKMGEILPKEEADENLRKMLDSSKIKEKLYHATPSDIKFFKPGGLDPRVSGEAIWLSNDPTRTPAAHNIGSYDNPRQGVNVMPVHVQAKNPMVLDDETMLKWAQEVYGEGSREFPMLMPKKWREEVMKDYDSIVLADPYKRGDSHEIIMFEPEKIKSAIGNRGTYNTDTADITKSKGGVLHMSKAGRVGDIVEGGLSVINKAKEIAKARKAAAEGSKIEEVLASQTPPMTRPQGTGLPLMPRDNGMYTLRDQKDLPRMVMVDKARAENKSPKYNERMQDLLDSPKARKKVDNLINKGKELNVQEWYGTEPLRQVALDAGRTPEQFESLMAQLASASQRNPVDKQNQMGSYLYHLSETGQLPENSLLLTNKLKKALKEDPSLAEGRQLVELPTGYGSLAQGDIFNRAVMIGQGKIGEALPPNKKLGTFYENLLGNLKPVTVDVNALRGPIIEQGDPRWLTSKLVEKDDKGKIINSYKPREMYNTGEMSMREAQQRPGFWEAAPSGSEYAGFEELWQRGAKRHNVEPAEAQALGWYGSADVTALKTKPENYVDNLERLIKRTAEQTGKSPTEVMNDLVTGEGFLRKDGGKVEEPHWHKVFNRKMKEGGYAWVDDKHIPKVRSLKHLAKGGSSDEPTTREIMEAMPQVIKEATSEEAESYKKPRSVSDVIYRGVVANNPISAGVDLMNMGLMGVDAVTGMMGKPTRLASEKPFAGSEHVKDLMNKYGVTSGEDRPISETILGIMSPTGMVKGVMEAPKMVQKAGNAISSLSKAKKARGGLTLMR